MTVLSTEETGDLIDRIHSFLPNNTGGEEDHKEKLQQYLETVTEPAILLLFKEIMKSDSLSTEKMYNTMAAFYDQAFPDRSHAVKILDLLDESYSAAKAVDLGCGTGESAIPLLEKAEQVIGLDISEKMIDKAKDKISNPALSFYRADFLEQPLEESLESDLVVSVGVSRHIPLGKEKEYFNYVRAMLKQGGTALIAFVIRAGDNDISQIDIAVERWMQSKGISDRRFDEDEIFRLFKETNFSIEGERREPSKYLYEKLLIKARKK
ncbi:MAG: class I SAM-dependent methyltransferase [bacterium]|nr:class I SAM-dependent methyltransferase [bacterium]